MLIVAYKINETLVANYEEDESGCSGAILIGLTLIILGANITWVVF